MTSVNNINNKLQHGLKTESLASYDIKLRASVKKIWNREYKLQPTIPSSHRLKPSHALIDVANEIDFNKQDVLDLGCGNGRNSIYMANQGARVSALDFSDVALSILRRNIADTKDDFVKTINGDICDGLPFSNNSMDIILDSYCLCHFIDIASAKKAMSECLRVLRPKGKVIKIHINADDQYYHQRIEKKTSFGHISHDPINSLRKAHFNIDSYMEYVACGFNLIKSRNVTFYDDVRGKRFNRNIFVCVLEKR